MTSVPPSSEVFSPAGIVWTPIAPALSSLRRTLLLAACAVASIVIVAAGILAGSPLIFAALLLPAAVLLLGWFMIGRQVSSYGYAERSDDLLIRKGLMFRSMVVVPYGRMQFVDVKAGPLERLFHIAQVQLHTASASSDAKIPGVIEGEAARLRDRLASRGQARLAGL